VVRPTFLSTVAVEKRSLKQEKLARIYDDQIAPV